jgi:ABC-type transporter Mla MlaB component
LVGVGDLAFDARQAFITRAGRVISGSLNCIEVDCSAVTSVDTATVGMLALLARHAHRHGRQVKLIEPPAALVRALTNAGVMDRFVTDG